jgi:hypothetical protein
LHLSRDHLVFDLLLQAKPGLNRGEAESEKLEW